MCLDNFNLECDNISIFCPPTFGELIKHFHEMLSNLRGIHALNLFDHYY